MTKIPAILAASLSFAVIDVVLGFAPTFSSSSSSRFVARHYHRAPPPSAQNVRVLISSLHSSSSSSGGSTSDDSEAIVSASDDDESTITAAAADADAAAEELTVEEKRRIGNLVADEEWAGLSMEIADVVRTAVVEDLKKNSREFLGKEDYLVGDFTKEIDKRVKAEIAKIREKDEYEVSY